MFQNATSFTTSRSTIGTCPMKEVALANIPHILVTLDTSHLLSGWLKELAPLNILVISVTSLDTFHLLKFSEMILVSAAVSRQCVEMEKSESE